MKKANVKVSVESGILTWNWADETATEIDIAELSAELYKQAAMHGLKQKLSDCYAGSDTVREAKLAWDSVKETLLSGLWNSGRSSSGGIWVEALAKAAAVTLEEALDKWNSMDEDMQKELKKHPGIKQAKAEIDLERATKKAEGTSIDLSEI